LSGVRDVVLYHHERYDGTGYPRGLKGEQIPFCARIVAIADSYDAMTSTRPYRQAFSRGKAIEELENRAGQMWDPALVRIFVAWLNENGDSHWSKSSSNKE